MDEKIQNEMAHKIYVALEAFRDDVLPIIDGSRTRVWVTGDLNSEIFIHWTSPRVRMGKEIKERFSVHKGEAAEHLVERIKAYLFDVTVCIINL